MRSRIQVTHPVRGMVVMAIELVAVLTCVSTRMGEDVSRLLTLWSLIEAAAAAWWLLGWGCWPPPAIKQKKTGRYSGIVIVCLAGVDNIIALQTCETVLKIPWQGCRGSHWGRWHERWRSDGSRRDRGTHNAHGTHRNLIWGHKFNGQPLMSGYNRNDFRRDCN